MGIRLFETSAKDNINVEEMFRAVTELVLKSKKVKKKVQYFLTLISPTLCGSERKPKR